MPNKSMTVKELKEELNNYDDGAEVYFNANGHYFSVTNVSTEEIFKEDDVVLV